MTHDASHVSTCIY